MAKVIELRVDWNVENELPYTLETEEKFSIKLNEAFTYVLASDIFSKTVEFTVYQDVDVLLNIPGKVLNTVDGYVANKVE